MTSPILPDLATIRAAIQHGKVCLSQADQRRIYAPSVGSAIYRGSNLLGDDCFDLLADDGQPTGWRVYFSSFSRPTPRGHHWKIRVARTPAA